MRVGQFLSHYPAPGGTTSVLRGLSSGLAELGHEVVVYGYGPNERQASTYERIFDAPAVSKRGLSAVAPPDRLMAALAANEDDLDVLVIHGMFSPFSSRIARVARSGGIRTVAQPHDPYTRAVFAERRLAKTAYWLLFERPYLRSVDAIQLYAPSHREHLVGLGVDAQTFIVPAGISETALEQAAEARRARLEDTEGTVRLLFLARFDIHNKGLDILLEAIAAEPGLRSLIQLECIGARSSKEYAAAERIVRGLDLGDRVRLSYRTEDPWSAFAQANLFVLPSRFDGFGQVVLESLAAGTPVVVSAAAGAAEFVGADEAVVVAQPSVEDLGRGLLKAISRLAKLKEAARDAHERLAETLTWTACARRWLEGVTQLRLSPAQAPETILR
jgi:glycosyltransferase involved in cell wall biosynthesis